MAFRTLRLTSPRMRGSEVAHAQWLLKHNRFGDFLPGAPIDGIYGQVTAHAVRNAKYWLGYYHTRVNARYGLGLQEYLTALDKGGRRLSAADALRRKRRLAKYKAGTQGRAVTIAMGQVGYSPGRCSKYSSALGRPCENWCADFISWCQHQVGSSFNYAYVPYIDGDAAAGRNGLGLTRELRVGYLATFDWNHDGEADHVEYAIRWITPGVSFWTVGGNTGSVFGQSGGQVLHQVRYTSEMWRSGVFVSVTR